MNKTGYDTLIPM